MERVNFGDILYDVVGGEKPVWFSGRKEEKKGSRRCCQPADVGGKRRVIIFSEG